MDYSVSDIHCPLAITHGNNIVLLLFKDGNIWSSYNNHLLQPIPFRPNAKLSIEDENRETDEMKDDYVHKSLNRSFKTRPLVIGNWRFGEGKQRWFLIKYIVSNDEITDMHCAMKEYSTLDWELSKEDKRSKLIYMISPAGRIWSCCSGGCWLNVGETDKAFNDKYNGLNDKQHKLVCSPLPYCRAGLTLVPEASYIRPMANYDEYNVMIEQMRCLCVPNEIVPLKMSHNEGEKLRGSYSNSIYGMDYKEKYFVHYNCIYLWDSWRIDNDIYSDRTTTIDGYVPYALCIVTRYPFHNSFERIMDNFVYIEHKDAINDVFMDNLYHLLCSISFNRIGMDAENEGIMISCPNGDTVRFENSVHLITSAYYTPSLHPDINWSVLFRVLEPMNILNVISGILQENKIILLSNHPSLLFACFEVLLSLIYPFEWIHFYRAFIPPSDPNINQYLHFTKPAMFGLMSTSITKVPHKFKGIIVRLESNTVELHGITSPMLPSKLTLWLFASIIQNADFYLHHQPEQQSFIKVPPQIQNAQLNAMRSAQFRSTYMNTTNTPRATRAVSTRARSTTTTTTAHARCKSMGNIQREIFQSKTSLAPLNAVHKLAKISCDSEILSKSLPLSKCNPSPSPYSEFDSYEYSEFEYKEMYPSNSADLEEQQLKEDEKEILDANTEANTCDCTTPISSSSAVVVNGQDIISIIDRVLLSNFSSNHNSSLIHQYLADYTQHMLQPDPLPKTKDAPPDTVWIEPSIFRKYKYYYGHMVGAKQSVYMSNNHASKRVLKQHRYEFRVTHTCITNDDSPTPHEDYIVKESFIGLNVEDSVEIAQHKSASRGRNTNKSGVLNWLFSSMKQQQNMNDSFCVNINLLRNHFMRAFASLLSGFWQYIVPIKYSTTTNVQFDAHGFIGSRQEFNYKKRALEEMLLVCDENKKDEIELIILRLQSQFDIFYVHELFIAPHPQYNALFMKTFYNINNPNVTLTPRTIARFYLKQVYPSHMHTDVDLDDKVNTFLDEYIASIITMDIALDVDVDDTDTDDERCMPRPRDALSSFVLSQFVDGLLSSLLWRHFINRWYFNEHLYCNDQSSNDNEYDAVYFTYFDVALRAYVMDAIKLKPLRNEILSKSMMNSSRNSIMFKDTSYHKKKKNKSIVVIRTSSENKDKLRCGFSNPWSIRFSENSNLDDLENTFRDNVNIIMIHISWNNTIGAVIGHGKSCISFQSWFASFLRKLSLANSFNDYDDYHEYNCNTTGDNAYDVGIQVFVSDVRSLKSIVTTLKRCKTLIEVHLHPLRIWITANLLNGTLSARSFFKYMDLIASFTMCLMCHLFTKQHIESIKHLVEQYIFKKTKKTRTKRSFAFCIETSALSGDGWKYLHSLLLDRFPSSSLIFTGTNITHESLSIAQFKWLSAHFPSNRCFYTFSAKDIDDDFDDLDLLHHVVEATKTPLWFGHLKQHRSHTGHRTRHDDDDADGDEYNAQYYDGGVLCSEWRTARFLERSKVYFFCHRFGIVNRGWILSKHEVYPPWKMNGRVLITGYTQLHILFRSAGAIYKTTPHGNVVYGIRATITTKGEFALETVRLDAQSNKVKSKIDSNPDYHQYEESCMPNQHAFIFPQSTSSSSSLQLKVFSFELIDYGALYPIQFSIQQLSIHNGYPISEKQSIKMQVSYPKDENKCPSRHYIVFNSHQSAMWPILVDRLVIDKDIRFQNKFHYLLNKKKTFNKKYFARGKSHKKKIADML